MQRFKNCQKLVNREIETVVLNTINPMNSKKLVTTFLMDFSFFARRFFRKNLRNFFSPMGNAPRVYERIYGVQKAKSFFLRELSPASELATLHWSYCNLFELILRHIFSNQTFFDLALFKSKLRPNFIFFKFNHLVECLWWSRRDTIRNIWM